MPGEMRKIDLREETEIFLKAETTAIEAEAEPGGATVMSLRCRWEGEIERRARVHHQRRKSLRLI
jgi:hypothetical protein